MQHQVSLADAQAVRFEVMSPARRFAARKGQRHLQGQWWSSTVAGPVASLLDSLHKAGADEQAAVLAGRAAAHAPLDDPGAVVSLRDAGAEEQAAALVGRLPAAGMFGHYLEQKGRPNQFLFGMEADGTPAAPWGWEDLDLWLVLQQRRQAPPTQH